MINVAKAKEMIFTGQILSSAEALQIGLVNYVEDNYEMVYKKALEIVGKIL